MLMWSRQRVVFHGIFVICFGHSISEPPFHVMSFLSFYEPCCGRYLSLAGKAENASCLPPLIPHPSPLAAGVQAHNLDSRDTCPRAKGKAYHQGCCLFGTAAAGIVFLGQQ